MPLIKVAYLMLNFLNLKSFLRHLFFLGSILPQHAVRLDLSFLEDTYVYAEKLTRNGRKTAI